MPATTWTEQSLAAKSDWQEITGEAGGTMDVVGDPHLTQPRFMELVVSWTESTVGATSFTESSVSATTWTEQT